MEKLNKIKEIILDECKKEGVCVEKIILFGSRARGDNREGSDFDIMVILKDEIDFKLKRLLITKIKRILAFERIPNDIIFYSSNYFCETKMDRGSLSYYVNKEGMVI